MQLPGSRWQKFILTAVVCLISRQFVIAADEPTLSKEQITQFLLTAKVVASTPWRGKGITHTWRLTLSDGTVTHDASFQPIDEHRTETTFANLRRELNFVDSYKYNIAAYQVAELLGMDDMLPVYVERKWKGDSGSLSWWLPLQMDEQDRLKRKIQAPDPDAWNNQMYKIRVFDELVYDTDPNLTNVQIGIDWKIYRVDFSRAFRQDKNLENSKNLVRCDRKLFAKLKALDGNELQQKTKGYLNKGEAQAVMARRDKIVDYFQKLIAEKGENEVLY
jgi:hypothetical protein